MKIRGLFKKAAATLMAAVTALSILPATTAFAAGDIGTISFSHTYDSSGNAMRYNSSATFDGHTAGGTGNYKYRMFVDGENAFCIQPGVPLNTGNTLKKASSDTWNALSANQKKAVGLALLYGYQGNRSNLTGSDDEKWVATQTLVWEFVTGCREATGSFSKTSDKVYSLHFGSNYANSGAKAAYDQIVSLMSEHHTIPSFMSGSKNGITKELAYKDGKYTLTFTDSNGVLSDYAFSSSDSKVSVSKSGNKLTISSAKAFDGTVRITATRNNMPIVSSSAKLIAYGDPNLQDLVTGVENADTVAAYINVETPTGTIALKKTSEDGIVEGIQFTIKGKDFNQTVKTDKNGNITVAGLVPDMAGKVLNSDFTLLPLDNITHHVASEDNGWNLILVNRNSYIPDDYKVELTELSNGEKVDSRIYPELQEMFNDARAQGYGLFVREGYRTQEEQQQLLDEKIEAYENEGKSKSEAKKLAEQWVAIPGTSEHQLGIAVDINADTTKSSSDDVYSWLAENAHKYGFIKRYPSDKTDITGVINEPWHYRYVGKEAALEIYSQGMCLEEYIDTLE